MKKHIILILLIAITFVACDKFLSTNNKNSKAGIKEVVYSEDGDTIINKYRDNGTLESAVQVKNGARNGTSYAYYDNGNVQFEINYNDGYKDGIVKYFYKSGKVYRITVFIKGLKEGVQRFYYEEGTIEAEVPYKDNSVMPGTKEYTKDGKLINDYPEIQIKPIDKLAFENKYELKFSLYPKKRKVKFSLKKKSNNTFIKYMLNGGMKNGVGTQTFNLSPGRSIMEKLFITAYFKSKRDIPVCIETTFNLAVENRNY